MPEEKEQNQVEESQPIGQQEETKQEFIPSYQQVADDVDSDNEVDTIVSELLESGDLSDDELAELANLSDDEIDKLLDSKDEPDESETSESDEEKEPQKETDDLDELISNRAQKRIDKLTAQNKSKDEELELLKVKLTELESKIKQGDASEVKDEDILTDEQLAKVLQKGIDEGDTSVIVDAMRYVAEQTKKSVLKEQENAQKAQMDKVQKRNAEWSEIVKSYSPDAYQHEELKQDPDFDITNNKSKLYRLSSKLFIDKNLANEENGQTRAVQEAYSILLENKLTNIKSKKKSTETEGLQSRLAKEQRKKSLLGGSDTAGDSAPVSADSDVDELAEYIRSRNKSKETSLGISI